MIWILIDYVGIINCIIVNIQIIRLLWIDLYSWNGTFVSIYICALYDNKSSLQPDYIINTKKIVLLRNRICSVTQNQFYSNTFCVFSCCVDHAGAVRGRRVALTFTKKKTFFFIIIIALEIQFFIPNMLVCHQRTSGAILVTIQTSVVYYKDKLLQEAMID